MEHLKGHSKAHRYSLYTRQRIVNLHLAGSSIPEIQKYIKREDNEYVSR